MRPDPRTQAYAERIALAIGLAALLAGCCLPGFGSSGSPPPPAPPVSVTPPAAPVPPPVAAPAAGAACLAGRWQATEIMGLIERDIRASTRGGEVQLVSSTGKLVLDIAPADATGAGTMSVRAEDLVHRFHGNPQGISVDVTHTLNGTSTMPYAFTPPDGLRVERPTQNDMRSRANANAGGFRMSQGSGARFDLRGTYVFVCSATSLSVRKPNGRVVNFTRE